MQKVAIVDCNMITAYGLGVGTCWNSLLENKTAIDRVSRFFTDYFVSRNAAIIQDLKGDSHCSYVMQMLNRVFKTRKESFPEDAFVILATTVGEIDILEQSVLKGQDRFKDSRPEVLLDKIKKACGLKNDGMIISAACVSSSAAIAYGAGLISSGQKDAVLIVGCDSVTEFMFSGFSSLMALDKDKACPFDKHRKGLTIGEAAGYLVLMSQKKARAEKKGIKGYVTGWGISADANHMTGPSRDGSGLAQAINQSFKVAGIKPKDVGSISAHGTGTIYNDSMEIKAFKAVFGKKAIPAYSIKGGTGHTMGAAGLVEAIISLKSLEEKSVPPTVNLCDIDDEAKGWVDKAIVKFNKPVALSTNSGVGGVNSALIIEADY